MITDDDALDHLLQRGIPREVIDVLRALLGSLAQSSPNLAPLAQTGITRRKTMVAVERCQKAMLALFDGVIPSPADIQDEPLRLRVHAWLDHPDRTWHEPGQSYPMPDVQTVRKAAGRGKDGIGLIVPNPPR